MLKNQFTNKRRDLSTVVIDPGFNQVVFKLIERQLHRLVANERRIGVHMIKKTLRGQTTSPGDKARAPKGGGEGARLGESCGLATEGSALSVAEVKIESFHAFDAGVFYHSVPDLPKRRHRNLGPGLDFLDIASAEGIDNVLMN